MNNEKYTLASLPLRGQRYFYVTWIKKRGVIVISRVFSADAFDYRAVKSEVAFKTAEAAEREKYNIYTALTGKEWER